jgi:ligand-binding sensor domain-containing protein
MSKYYINNPIYSLLLMLTLFTSCKGQNKSQIESVNPTKIITSGNPKMIRTQGTNYTQVGCGFQDKAGNLWFGTLNEGVYRYDGKSLTNFLNKDYMFHHKIHAQLIMDMLQDKKGNIWFSSWNGGGVWRYDPAAARRTGVDSFTNFSPSADYYLSNEDGRSFNKADNDPLKYSRPKATVDYRPKDFIHDDMIESISEDKAGNIWFATRRHGACRYDGKYFTSFKEKEGFVSYGISSIVEDKKGNFWFATGRNGVWSYDGKNFTTVSDYKE